MNNKELQKKLDEYFERLRKFANVLNVNVGDEVKDGVKTGKRAIVVFVSKKKPLTKLKAKDTLPDTIENIPIDVIELSPDYKLGDTTPSHLSPTIQKRIANGVRKNGKK